MDKNDVKACLRALLSSSTISYSLNSLLLAFKNFEGCSLPTFEFDSPISFLKSLDDTVKLIGDPQNPEVCLVKSEKSSHIISLVERQRNKVRKKLPHLAHRSQRIVVPNNNQTQKTYSQSIQWSYSSQENNKDNKKSFESKTKHPKKQQPVFPPPSESPPKKGEKNHEKENLEVVAKADSCFFEDISEDESLVSTEETSSTRSSGYHFQGYVNEGMKNKLKNLIKNHPNGLWCCDLPRCFLEMYNFELDYREFGYTSLIRMLSELPDIFRCVRPGCEDWILFDASVPPSPKEQKMSVSQTEGHIPQEIRDNLKRVLSICFENYLTSDVEVNEILELYKEIIGKELNVFDLGFQNVKSFLGALEGSILTTLERNNKVFVCPIPKPCDESSSRWREALPPITADDDIFYDLFPSDVVGPDEKLIELDLKAHVAVGQRVEVCVAEVWSPAKFYLQFNEYKNLLNTFMNELQNFYNTYLKKYKMPDATVRAQQVCVGLYNSDPMSPEEWNRAKILKVINEKIVSVCFVDYGTVTRVKKSQLRFLHKSFSSFPVQAYEAKLAGVGPPQDETKWSVSASKRFLDLLRIPYLEAKMVDVDFSKPLMHVVLFDRLQNPAININKQLISEKLAIPSGALITQMTENCSKNDSPQTNLIEKNENSTDKDSVFEAVSDLNICDDDSDMKVCDAESNLKIQPLSIFTSTNSLSQLSGHSSPQENQILLENSASSSESTTASSLCSPESSIRSRSLGPPPALEDKNLLLEYKQLQYFLLKQQQEETRKRINLLAVELLATNLSLKEIAMTNPEFALKTATLIAEHYINSLNPDTFFYPSSCNLDVSSGAILNNSSQRQNSLMSSCNQTINTFRTVDNLIDNSKIDEEKSSEINEIHKMESNFYKNNDGNSVGKNETNRFAKEMEKEAIEMEKSNVSSDSEVSEESTVCNKTEDNAVEIEEKVVETGTDKKVSDENISKEEKCVEAPRVSSPGKKNEILKEISIGSKMLHVVTIQKKKYFSADELIKSLTVISSREIADIILNSKRFNPEYRILNKKNDGKILQVFQSCRLFEFLKKKKKKTVVYLLPIDNFLPFLQALGCCTDMYEKDFKKLLQTFEETPNEQPVS